MVLPGLVFLALWRRRRQHLSRLRKPRHVKQKEETNPADPEFGKHGDPEVAEENNEDTCDDDEGNEDNAREGKCWRRRRQQLSRKRKLRDVKQKEETNLVDPELGKHGDTEAAEENNEDTDDDERTMNEDNPRNGICCVVHFPFLCSRSTEL